MKMNTPSFWYAKEPSFASTALKPLSGFYLIGHLLHQHLGRPTLPKIPVICVGNLTAGGGGKTPTAMAIMHLIQKMGLYQNPGFLTRGYGRTTNRAIKALKNHAATDIGDEAMLLRDIAPTYVSSDRLAGLDLAMKDDIDCLIMDDGYQNTHIETTLRILVVNSFDGFGNESLLPAGPLRQPISTGILKADIIVVVDDPRGNDLDENIFENFKNPILISRFKNNLEDIDKKQKYISFAGIALPDKFFGSLKHDDLNLIKTLPYPDHHSYTQNELEELVEMAKEHDARLLTTSKDFARIPSAFKDHITAVDGHLTFDDEQTLQDLLKSGLTS